MHTTRRPPTRTSISATEMDAPFGPYHAANPPSRSTCARSAHWGVELTFDHYGVWEASWSVIVGVPFVLLKQAVERLRSKPREADERLRRRQRQAGACRSARHALGGEPWPRLNARLKASSES